MTPQERLEQAEERFQRAIKWFKIALICFFFALALFMIVICSGCSHLAVPGIPPGHGIFSEPKRPSVPPPTHYKALPQGIDVQPESMLVRPQTNFDLVFTVPAHAPGVRYWMIQSSSNLVDWVDTGLVGCGSWASVTNNHLSLSFRLKGML